MRRTLLTGAGLGALLGTAVGHAAADDSLGTITVTATRIATPVIEAPATVSVVTAAEIDDLLIDDIKDLVRFEPGVSVRSQPSRFTAALGSTGRDGNFNVFDKKYAWWSDVRGLAASSATLDAYTQPGRNLSVSLTGTF